MDISVLTSEYEKRKSNLYFNDKHSGRTMCKSSRGKNVTENCTVTFEKNPIICDGVIHIPMTEIDDEFDTASLSLRTGQLNEFVVNKEDLWEALETRLSDCCVSYRERHNKYTSETDHLYVIPIIRIDTFPYDEVSNKSRCMRSDYSKRYLKIKGREYDPDFIYRRTATELVFDKVAPTRIPFPNFKNDMIKQISTVITNESGKKTSQRYLNHSSLNMIICPTGTTLGQTQTGAPVVAREPDTAIIVNIGKFVNVTNIGVIGEPLSGSIFSKKSRKKRGRTYVSGGSIYLLNEDNVRKYVKTFELYYKDSISKKWIHVGHYQGTSSAHIETIIDLTTHFTTEKGIYTDALKIVPKSYEGFPEMRIAVYGYNQTVETVKSSETVTYIVTHTSPRSSISDRGCISSKCSCYFCAFRRNSSRKGKFRRALNMDMRERITYEDYDNQDQYDDS